MIQQYHIYTENQPLTYNIAHSSEGTVASSELGECHQSCQ